MSDPVLLTDGPDTGLVSHMRNPIAEQRLMVDGGGSVELSNREVLAISGVDRLGWLHSLTSQFLDGMERGRTTTSLVLSPTGHVEHVLHFTHVAICSEHILPKIGVFIKRVKMSC